MQLGTCPVDVAVQSSTRLPVLVPGEAAENVVEISTVPEQVICSGDKACGIQSSVAGESVHRPCNHLSLTFKEQTASPSQNL